MLKLSTKKKPSKIVFKKRHQQHDLLSYTNNDRQAGQGKADQQHAQEEEVGTGGSERTCGWTTVVDQWKLRMTQQQSNTNSELLQAECTIKKKKNRKPTFFI